MKKKLISQKINNLISLKFCKAKFQLSLFYCCLVALLLLLTSHFSLLTVKAANTVLQAGVSIDKVPKELYGTWRVSAKLISTNTQDRFKNNSVDLWNLSRAGNVIKLDNPFSGANASVVVSYVGEGSVKFKRINNYDDKKLTDTVQLILRKDSFKGINSLKIDTISQVDGHIMKTEWAEYELLGDKISGESINEQTEKNKQEEK